MSSIFIRTVATAAIGLCVVTAAARAEDAPAIEMKDGVVTPQSLELAADTATTLVVRNTGTAAAEFESKRLKQEQVVAPGSEVKIDLPALPAGEYEFVDEFHEDQASARGTIVVK